MKKIMTFIFILISPLSWADYSSYTDQRSWTAAISTWPQFNGYISKDFFANDSGLGISTTSRLNYAHPLEDWSAYNNYYKTISFEQTTNLDLLLGWFHLQIQIGPSFSLYEVNEEETHNWKKSLGFTLGTNIIISKRAVLSLLVRSMAISDQETIGSGGLYLGWRF